MAPSSPALFVALAVSAACLCTAMYVDEAGVFDWKWENVGVPLFTSYSPNGKALFVATQVGVLAAISMKTGGVNWRRVLAEDSKFTGLQVFPAFQAIATLSQVNVGVELETWTFKGDQQQRTVFSTISQHTAAKLCPLSDSSSKAYMTVVTNVGINVVVHDKTDGHSVAWSHSVDSGAIVDVAGGKFDHQAAVVVLSTSGTAISPVTVTILSLASGSLLAQQTTSTSALAGSVVMSPSANGVVTVAFVTADGSLGLQRVVPAASTVVVSPSSLLMETSLVALENPVKSNYYSPDDAFLLVVSSANEERRVLKGSSAADAVTVVSTLPPAASLATLHSEEGPVLIRTTIDRLESTVDAAVLYSPFSDALHIDDFPVKSGGPQFQSITGHVTAKSHAVSFVVTWQDGTLSGIVKGDTQWRRQEYLATVSQLAYVDVLPVAAAADDTVVPQDLSLVGRLKSQAADAVASFASVAQSLAQLPVMITRVLEGSSKTAEEKRAELNKDYGFEKLVLTLSPVSHNLFVVAALNSLTSAVVWETPVVVASADSDLKPVLFVTRSRPFGSHPPEIAIVFTVTSPQAAEVTVYGTTATKLSAGTATVVVVLSALSGHVLNVVTHKRNTHRAFPLGTQTDSAHTSILLGSDVGSNTFLLYPTTSDALGRVEALVSSTVLHSADENGSEIVGYSLVSAQESGVFSPKRVWTVRLPESQSLRLLSHADPHEPVSTAAVVLGDDSLLTKYLNPHLLAIVSSSGRLYDRSNSSSVEIRLVDGIVGKQVWSRVIPHASAPVHIARSENTVVLTFWNTKSKRTEMLSIAMFEDGISRFELNPLNAPVQKPFRSSYDSVDPIVLSQIFVSPAGVTAAAALQTRYGITSPHVLFGLSTGSVLSVNRLMLDPRRPRGEPSPADIDERLVPYAPFLPMTHKAVVTTVHTIPRIRDIISMHTTLESTSIVAVAGLDLFVSPVVPVTGFDTLSSSFNKPVLVIIITALAGAVLVLKGFVVEKQLQSRWK